MGKLINEQEIVQKNVQKHIETSASEYTRYMDSTPTFVTYYQRNTLESTADRGLDNVERYVGGSSPTKFRKIENMPLYGIESLSLDLSREDTGLNTTYEGDATIIPNTIRPYAEDFFVIGYIGRAYLFKLSKVTNDAVRSKPFYKIDFSLFKKLQSVDEVDEQVEGEYTVVFRNIGTEEKAVIEKTDFMTVDYASKIYDKLRERFLKYFYDPQVNVISYDAGPYVLYNRFLNHFLSENRLLEGNYSYLSSIRLSEEDMAEPQTYESYRRTIYAALERQSADEMEGQFVYPMSITSRHTAFAHFGRTFHSVNFVDTEGIEFFPEAFYGRLKMDNPFTDGTGHEVENMVIEYVYGRLRLTDEHLETVDKTSFYPGMYSYVFIPIILYILKDLQNKLLRTTK